MGENGKKEAPVTSSRVPIAGYVALIFAIVFFSGVFAAEKGALGALDFNIINGKFGTMKDFAKATLYGGGGIGARDGFLFAITLFPGVMLALGIVEVIDYYGGLKAAEKLMSPILKPLMGIPGITGLAMVTSLQSTDAGSGMTRLLRESNLITEREKSIFAAFQFSSGASITNYLTIGSALFAFIKLPIIIPLGVIFVMKIFGANLMRFYLNRFYKGDIG
ncbi:MAG: nucleoside recognition domain-containing protein [Negativicutes bacterium]